MRCKSCDALLSSAEFKRKSVISGEYFDLCNGCVHPIVDDIDESLPDDDPIWDEWLPELFDEYYDD